MSFFMVQFNVNKILEGIRIEVFIKPIIKYFINLWTQWLVWGKIQEGFDEDI